LQIDQDNCLAINGHFLKQPVTGVQRYAHEIIRVFDHEQIPYRYVEPPESLESDSLRQLWMQGVMPFKTSKNELLWSPTNIGPVLKEKQVITLHDIADQLYPEWFNDRYVQWRSLILPSLLRRVKGIITVSQYSKQTILEQFPYTEGKINVIYNGVRLEHFYKRDAQEVKLLRDKYNLKHPFVITVGSLDPRKNTNRLLKAWNLISKSYSRDIELAIVGGGMETFDFAIEESIGENVRFLGYVDDEDLPGLYTASQVFIYPSLFEGFGLPVLEAMACQTPVITSNTTSLSELAQNYALTINPHTVKDIARGLEQLLTDQHRREEMSAKGYDYARKFKWSKSARKTYQYLCSKQ